MLPLIPTRATDQEMSGYVSNIVATYRRATPDQLARGHVWYHVAHDLATVVGNGDVRMGAGVIAALSQQRSWRVNCMLARDARNGNVHGQTGNTLAKVHAILAGADPADLLPMDLKTGQFYLAIIGDAHAVVIDRHAHDVAVGKRYGESSRGLSNPNRYATLAHAFTLAGDVLGTPDVQPVTWLVQKESTL